jgi:hypothetical protein
VTFSSLSPPYSTIVADPPWKYAKTNADLSGDGYVGRSGLPYSGMSIQEIQDVPVAGLAAFTEPEES